MSPTLQCYTNIGCFFLIFIITSTQLTNAAEDGPNVNEADIKKFKLWRHGTIPYLIDEFSFDKGLRDKIRAYLEETSMRTGLKFVELIQPPDTESTRWVLFLNRRGLLGCDDNYDTKFTNEGVQRVLLGYDCVSTGKGEGMASAILALAGVPPQHNAPDRDEFIEVHDDNILPDKIHLFKVLGQSDWLFKDLKYDFMSASHYDFYKYTKNGRATITATDKTAIPLFDDRFGLSFTDILKIRYLYKDLNPSQKEITQDCNKIYKPGHNFKKLTSKPKESTVQPNVQKLKFIGHKNLKNDKSNYTIEPDIQKLNFVGHKAKSFFEPTVETDTVVERKDDMQTRPFKSLKKLKYSNKQLFAMLPDVDTAERI